MKANGKLHTVQPQTRKQVEAQKTIEKEMARLDAKLERVLPEDFLWGDYDALRLAMYDASKGMILSKGFCEFTHRHKKILSRLIAEEKYNDV
jgi:hypothetical protein